jgi:hypothetical protein
LGIEKKTKKTDRDFPVQPNPSTYLSAQLLLNVLRIDYWSWNICETWLKSGQMCNSLVLISPNMVELMLFHSCTSSDFRFHLTWRFLDATRQALLQILLGLDQRPRMYVPMNHPATGDPLFTKVDANNPYPGSD